ncbi:response regulator [Halobacteriales archaeon QH_10_67_13]|nr:MAG: response regulator [Halobacteriales archaeon QH_10_67_13]
MSIDVLVVDEDPDILQLAETFLERESDAIAAETTNSAAAALDCLGEIDCLVTDLRMPEMSGFELAERVRETGDLPVFLFTAASVDPERAESAGVTGVVRKGAGTDHYVELADAIEAAV